MDWEFIIDIAKKLAAPVATFVGGWSITWLRRRWRFRRFCRAFGAAADSEENLFLCVPLWAVKDDKLRQPRFQKKDADNKVHEHYGPTDVLSQHDVEAAFEIASLFGEFFARPLPVLNDTQKFDLTGKTGIFVASPLVNLRARAILAAIQQPLLQINIQDESADHPAKLEIHAVSDGTRFDSSGDKEYSIIMRVPNPHEPDGFLFLVFGAHAEGTLAAGTYLRKNWTLFLNAQPTALIILEMPRGSPEMALAIRKYGI